jgi:hypothetical protein
MRSKFHSHLFAHPGALPAAKNSCFVSGHDFTGCEKLLLWIRARLYRLRKTPALYQGTALAGP